MKFKLNSGLSRLPRRARPGLVTQSPGPHRDRSGFGEPLSLGLSARASQHFLAAKRRRLGRLRASRSLALAVKVTECRSRRRRGRGRGRAVLNSESGRGRPGAARPAAQL